jgi:hypothetical protein
MPDQTVTHTTPPGAGENTPPTAPVSAAAAKRDLARQEQFLLPEESVQDFRLLRLGMHEDLRPRGMYECVLVERYIVNQWRTQRCAIMEAELIAHRREYATAWANPRRVKVTPTAGAVWGDDQQFYGGALEKLAKHEYRLSLECSRLLRQLAQRQKAREEEVGTAWEPQISQIDADAQRQKKATAEPRISRMDTDELPVLDQEDDKSVLSVKSVAAVPLSHAAEPTTQSGNLQNELPPPGGKVKAATKEAKPMQGKPRRAPYDTDKLRAEIERRVNRQLTAQGGALSPLRHTWVGSGG